MENPTQVTESDKYKTIFNESLDATLITDGKTGKIVEANKACETMFGYIPEELVGCHYSVLLPEEMVKTTDEYIDVISIYNYSFASKKVRKKDGSVCFMDFTLNVIPWGDEKAILLNFRDITERLQAEEKIRQYTEELSELNASKDKFFSIIAHDLKSPFNGLLGFAEFLSEDYDDLTEQERREYSGNIYKSAKDIYRLLNNLLEWSWISTGKQNFNPERISLSKAVKEIVQLLSANAAAKNICIEYICNHECLINADPNMLNSVFQNLLSNAIKFTPEGGSILIETLEKEDKIETKIYDSGVGITKSDIEKIFNPKVFHSTQGTRKEKGTGLGLIITKEFVEKNNGTISVQSKVGNGTTFTIVFPKVQAEVD